MLTVCVANRDLYDLVGELPDVRRVIWDGTGQAPEAISDAQVLIPPYATASTFDAAALARLRELRVIQLMSAGVDHWLPQVPLSVTLCNGRGIHGGSTAELAVTGLFAVLRDMPRFARQQLEHRWEPQRGQSLDGLRVLVLGVGDIGAKIADAVQVFGAQVTRVGRTARPGVHALSDVAGLLGEHEVVAIALPRTAETDGLVDAAFLASMPDGAVLVNVARGAIVGTEALLDELRSGRLRAFLDVVDPEPLPPDHPLWDAPNLVLTPHVGGGASGWRRRARDLVARQVQHLRDGVGLENVVGAGGY